MKKILPAAAAMLTLAAASSPSSAQQQFEPARKLQIAEAIIENFYVDSVNADTIVQEAIEIGRASCRERVSSPV